MKVVVYTAITGNFNDELREPLDYQPCNDWKVRYVCFTDAARPASTRYEIKAPQWEHENPRRTARWHKINSHLLFPDADFTIWHDGSHQFIVDPVKVALYLAGEQFGAFKHPDRKCVYEELKACIRLRKDDALLMTKQVESYRLLGYPKDHGLYETALVARTNSQEVKILNERWWSYLVRGSYRDQLSINYAMYSTGFRSACYLPGCRDRSEFLRFYPHR